MILSMFQVTKNGVMVKVTTSYMAKNRSTWTFNTFLLVANSRGKPGSKVYYMMIKDMVFVPINQVC